MKVTDTASAAIAKAFRSHPSAHGIRPESSSICPVCSSKAPIPTGTIPTGSAVASSINSPASRRSQTSPSSMPDTNHTEQNNENK